MTANVKRWLWQIICCEILQSNWNGTRFRHTVPEKSGIIQVTRCGQEVLERTACEIERKRQGILLSGLRSDSRQEDVRSRQES